jgi:hypothetical protein
MCHVMQWQPAQELTCPCGRCSARPEQSSLRRYSATREGLVQTPARLRAPRGRHHECAGGARAALARVRKAARDTATSPRRSLHSAGAR